MNNQKPTHIGSIFLTFAIIIFLIACMNFNADVRAELRDWLKAIGGGLVSIAIFYFTQEANERARLDRKEQEELSNLQHYFDKISTLVIEQELTNKTNVDKEVQIARALTANILRVLSPERINQVSDFLYSMNLCKYHEEEFLRIYREKCGVPYPFQSISLFYQIQLEGADLKGWKARFSDLSHAILKNADLSNASFMGSNLSQAYLQNANLKNADLSNASFMGSNLSQAYLQNANLENANLENANFQGANLHRTLLSQHLTKEQQKQCAIYEPHIKKD